MRGYVQRRRLTLGPRAANVGAKAPSGPPSRLEDRAGDDPDRHFSVVFEGDVDAPVRTAGNEVPCAVDGVEDPSSGRFAWSSELLTQDSVVRSFRREFSREHAFHFEIGIGDDRPAGLAVRMRAPCEQVECERRGFVCQPKGQFQVVGDTRGRRTRQEADGATTAAGSWANAARGQSQLASRVRPRSVLSARPPRPWARGSCASPRAMNRDGRWIGRQRRPGRRRRTGACEQDLSYQPGGGDLNSNSRPRRPEVESTDSRGTHTDGEAR